MLALDALEGRAPAVWAVLTTPSTSIEPSDFYRAREVLLRAMRRRWPDCEVACLVEFTTGYGPRSGGRRRPHWNLLVKGLDAGDVPELRRVIERVWCPRVGGKAGAQHVGTVNEAGGLMRYLALHFQKESQAPPPGWSGHRFIKTRGYLWKPTPEARQDARESLRAKREVWRALEAGFTGEAVEAVVRAKLEGARLTTWRLASVDPVKACRADEAQPRAPMTRHTTVLPDHLVQRLRAGA